MSYVYTLGDWPEHLGTTNMALQQLITSIHTKEDTMKIKLIPVLTTIALFALPVADAFAGHYS